MVPRFLTFRSLKTRSLSKFLFPRCHAAFKIIFTYSTEREKSGRALVESATVQLHGKKMHSRLQVRCSLSHLLRKVREGGERDATEYRMGKRSIDKKLVDIKISIPTTISISMSTPELKLRLPNFAPGYPIPVLAFRD